MRTHPDIGLMTARQQACRRLAAICAFLAVLVSMKYSRFTVKALERRIQVRVITNLVILVHFVQISIGRIFQKWHIAWKCYKCRKHHYKNA